MSTDAPVTALPASKDWQDIVEEFRTENFTSITMGVKALLDELSARVFEYVGGESLPNDSSILLHKLQLEPIILDGVTFDEFWLSRLEVRPYTTTTTIVSTELVIGKGEYFVRVEFYAGVSSVAALKLSDELRSRSRL